MYETLRKPEEICCAAENSTFPLHGWPVASAAQGADADRFASTWQRRIAVRLGQKGFHLRRGTLGDIATIDQLHRLCRPRFSEAQRPSALTYYQLLRFGLSVVLEDHAGEVVAYNMLQLLGDAQRTALGSGTAVHPRAAGAGLGTAMARYTSLVAMIAGARVRLGTIHPANGASLSLFVNHLGSTCRAYFPDLAGPGEGRLECSVQLTPEGLTRNIIDSQRLRDFVTSGREGIDYRLLPADDSAELERLYQTGSFRITAFARAGLVSNRPQLIALPASRLGLPVNLEEITAA